MSPSQRRALVSCLSTSMAFGLVLATILGCSRGRTSRPEPSPDTGPYGGGQTVTFDKEPRKEVSRVEELIEGRFTGVQVQRAGEGYSVSIRGTGSFMSSEQPLWVIDGMPYEVGRGRGMGWLNPADVVRITVLKNPSETSIYGVRGANGVIIITTQRRP